MAEHRQDRAAGAKKMRSDDPTARHRGNGDPENEAGYWLRSGLGALFGARADGYSDAFAAEQVASQGLDGAAADTAGRAEPDYDEPEYDESDDGEPDYGDADYVPGPEEMMLADGS